MRLDNFKFPDLHCNSCDGRYSSIDVHFTGICDNQCKHCIDRITCKDFTTKPNKEKIVKSILSVSDRVDDVLFLGGEPCLFLDELIYCIEEIRKKSNMKVYVTTAVPITCYKNRDKFEYLLSIVDGLNISAQSYKEEDADKIRCTKSQYDRQAFYNSLPHKEKIRINLNLVKPWLYNRDEILRCLHHYDDMGFGTILLRELQNAPDVYVSFEKEMGIKLPSAYSYGCQTPLIICGESFKANIILKRACFVVNDTCEAQPVDLLKAFIKVFKKVPNNFFCVVKENGEIGGWN